MNATEITLFIVFVAAIWAFIRAARDDDHEF
jgi:hypothetical protein